MGSRSDEPVTETNPILTHVREALSTVIDPEIRRPITDLGMVDDLTIDDAGIVHLTVLLTIAGCPMRNTIEEDVTNAVHKVPGVTGIDLQIDAMNEQQRAELTEKLRGGRPAPVIQFAQPESRTRVVAVASGKGGVGKSSMTVNLALALAKQGFSVGLLDADIYGHSIPDLLGIPEDARPTMVDSMIMPVPVEYVTADGKKATLRVISMGMLKESRDQVIAWRGPILDRAITQLLAEVFWGDLDFFLIDLPPGTGDVAMSIGQKLPGSDMIVVTTPQTSVSWVSERAGTMGSMLHQNVIGVIENMSWFETTCPNCNKAHRIEFFGSGGGQQTADALSDRVAREVPLLGQIPMEYALGAGAEINAPIVVAHPESPAALAIAEIAQHLVETKASLVGKPLGLKVNS